MPKIKERILNEEDLANSAKEEKNATKLVTDNLEYGEIRIPKTWTKPPILADLQHDIDFAAVEHQKEVDRVDEHLDFYHTVGLGRPRKVEGKSNAQPQSIRKASEWRYAKLSEPFLDSPKIFKGEPATKIDIEGTRQSTLVLNHQFKHEIGLQNFVDSYVKDAVDTGTAIIRTSWDLVEITRQEEVEVVKYEEEPRLAEPYEKMMELMNADLKEFKRSVPPEVAQALLKSFNEGKPLKRVVVRKEMSTITDTIKNQPKLEICDYRDVIPDPTCKGKQEDMKFCGFIIRTTKADLKNDPRYFNVDDIIVASSSKLNRETGVTHQGEVIDQDSDSFQFKDENRQPIEGIEYWGFVDVEGNGTLSPVVFTWFGKVLVRAEENPYPDKKIPFTFVPYLKRRNSLYGDPDGALIQEDQKISGAIVRGVIDTLAKNANGQRGIPKGALDFSNLIKYRAGQDYEFNPTAQIGRDGIAQITKFPEIPQSAIAIQQLSEQNIKEMTGTLPNTGSQNMGNSLGTQLEQPQAAGMSQAARRELGILRRLADGIIIVGHKICAMNKEFLNDEEFIRITDETFATVRREELDCKYDLSLSISTAEDDATKAGELAFMLQTAQASMDANFSREVLADIADLRRMPDKAEKYRNFKPTPDPHAEKLKQLQLAKLDAEVQEILSRAEENRAEAERESANAVNLHAQAKLAIAKAEAIDLKYIEDEQGLSHQRNLEKQQAQAEGNIRLKSHEKALERGDKAADKEEKDIDDEIAREREAQKPIQSLDSNLTSPANTSTNVPEGNATPIPSDQSVDSFADSLNTIGNIDDLLQ